MLHPVSRERLIFRSLGSNNSSSPSTCNITIYDAGRQRHRGSSENSGDKFPMNVSTFRIEQMCCPTEERMIRDRLGKIAGVENLEFNLMSRTLAVTHRFPDISTIVTAIAALGMDAVSTDAKKSPQAIEAELRPAWRTPEMLLVIISGICAVAAEMIALFWLGEDTIVVWLLAGVAIVTGGYQTAGKAWRSLRTLTLNINFLMSAAVIGAVALGEWGEAAMVIFLFGVAELVERRSLDRARNAIRSLMELAPNVALTLRGLGWETVPVEEIEPGAIIRIKPGERLPLDGVVRHGFSTVNQAPITGESMPVEKSIGDQVFAGSINAQGTFDYEATRSAEDSTISRIIRMVEQAGSNRAGAERFVDRFARYYTPAIFAIAFILAILPPLAFGGLWSEWIYRGLVMLVIGCPCALVISTPVTVVSGLAAAARAGILIKGGTYLELARDLSRIAFDKTGTLTEGRPYVTDVISHSEMPDEEILHFAALVEARSEHPIASAIVAQHALVHVDEEEIVVTDFHAIPGSGARGNVDGQMIYVGNHRLAHDLGVCSPSLEEILYGLESQGKSAVVVLNQTRALGVIAVADRIRSASAEAVRELHELGIRTTILTGDNRTTALSIASQLGIDDVRADLLPDEKIRAIAEFQREGEIVGMVGDGVNDVPALAQATIGFAMGAAGTDVALETADVALMEDNLMKIPEFIRLSRRTIRLLKQNIAMALGIKLVFFTLALAGEATLWMAVFADMGASLIVVGNGLRLLKKGRKSVARNITPTPSLVSPDQAV